jgi:hypothetical protein
MSTSRPTVSVGIRAWLFRLDDAQNTPLLGSGRDHYDRNENDEFAGSRFELSVAKLSSPSRRLNARNKRRPAARRSMMDDGQAKNGNLENRGAGARAQRIRATD